MVNTIVNDKTITIHISNRFEFGIHKEVRKAYEMINNDIDAVIINLEKVKRLDSSAIGMLLQIKDHCSSNKLMAKITGCSNEIKYIFSACHINDAFEIV